jgi:hypothetical protein
MAQYHVNKETWDGEACVATCPEARVPRLAEPVRSPWATPSTVRSSVGTTFTMEQVAQASNGEA